MSDCLVIIPTYNEKENIGKMIRTVMTLPHPFNLLVVDDNSKDGTAQIVKDLMLEYPDRLFMEQRAGKLGLGTAYIHGFRWAMQQQYSYIFEMDADFSHNPDDLVRLYRACANDGADLSIGSRYITGVNVVNWPMGRVMMSYFASMYVRIVTRMQIRDTTAGFKCYTRKVLETIDASGYTYLKLQTASGEQWAAVTQAVVAVGADANWLAGLLLLPAAVTVALALAIELIYQGAVSVLRGARVRGCAWQMPSRCTGAQRKA